MKIPWEVDIPCGPDNRKEPVLQGPRESNPSRGRSRCRAPGAEKTGLVWAIARSRCSWPERSRRRAVRHAGIDMVGVASSRLGALASANEFLRLKLPLSHSPHTHSNITCSERPSWTIATATITSLFYVFWDLIIMKKLQGWFDHWVLTALLATNKVLLSFECPLYFQGLAQCLAHCKHLQTNSCWEKEQTLKGSSRDNSINYTNRICYTPALGHVAEDSSPR